MYFGMERENKKICIFFSYIFHTCVFLRKLRVARNENRKGKSTLRVSLKKIRILKLKRKHIFFMQLSPTMVVNLGKRIFLMDIELYKNDMYWGP